MPADVPQLLLHFALLVCSLLLSCTALTSQQDILALLAIKHGFSNGATLLSSWNETVNPMNPCDSAHPWEGVICSCENSTIPNITMWNQTFPCDPDLDEQRVFGLELTFSKSTREKLTGPIAPDIGNLTELRYLNLNGHRINGSIPPSLVNLKNLETVVLNSNNLTGKIPEGLANLTYLYYLSLRANRLSGQPPEDWCYLKPGMVVDVARNYLCNFALNDNCLWEIPLSDDPDSVAGPVDVRTKQGATLLFTNYDSYACCNATICCDKEDGCSVTVPAKWTDINETSFSFKSFDDSLSKGLDYTAYVVLDPEQYIAGFDLDADLDPEDCDFVTTQRIAVLGTNILPAKSVNDEAMEENEFSKFYFSQENILQSGMKYRVAIMGQIRGCKAKCRVVLSGPVLYTTESNKLVTVLAVCLGIVVPAVLLVVLGMYISRVRAAQREMENERRRQALEEFRTLLLAMDHMKAAAIGPGRSVSSYPSQGSLYTDAQQEAATGYAFVVTDLENSTACAAASATAYKMLQQIHDQVVREEIPNFEGCEVGSQGDSFEIVFDNVANAVNFCMVVQHRLLMTLWPRAVLKLPSNNEVRDSDGIVALRGPRVRMGVHWAKEGTDVRCSDDTQTRMSVFHGPGWDVVNEVADAGSGGQVLLTHDAWLQLRPNMADAGFPVVHRLGLFASIAGASKFMWLYEVLRPLGTYLFRQFPAPRKLQQALAAPSFELVPPPVLPGPRDGAVAGGNREEDEGATGMAAEGLVFVAVRLEHVFMQQSKASGGYMYRLPRRYSPAWPRRSRWAALPVNTLQRLNMHLFSVAMQYGGYAFGCKQVEVNDLVFAFGDVYSALCFCHATQLMLMHVPWGAPNAHLRRMFGPTVTTPDGRKVFHGPRLAMAIHLSNHHSARYEGSGIVVEQLEVWPADVVYGGHAVELVKTICSVATGGQVVMPLHTWEKVAKRLPAQMQVLNLGSHILSEAFEEPMTLIEVLPAQLAMRNFNSLSSYKQLSKGFRESPSPEEDMALCYVKVAKPFEVHEAIVQCGKSGRNSSDRFSRADPAENIQHVDTLTSFFMGVYIVENAVRQLLAQHDGYECKHPELGKFTLAFSDLEQCLRFCCDLQLRLTNSHWPAQLLEWRDCVPQQDDADTVIFSGLRVCTGITWGRPDLRKPLQSGRADYFGNMANLAARLMSTARPGEVLVATCPHLFDVAKPVHDKLTRSIESFLMGQPLVPLYVGDSLKSPDTILLNPLGYLELKGIAAETHVYQVVLGTLAKRDHGTHVNVKEHASAGRALWLLGLPADGLTHALSPIKSAWAQLDASFSVTPTAASSTAPPRGLNKKSALPMNKAPSKSAGSILLARAPSMPRRQQVLSAIYNRKHSGRALGMRGSINSLRRSIKEDQEISVEAMWDDDDDCLPFLDDDDSKVLEDISARSDTVRGTSLQVATPLSKSTHTVSKQGTISPAGSLTAQRAVHSVPTLFRPPSLRCPPAMTTRHESIREGVAKDVDTAGHNGGGQEGGMDGQELTREDTVNAKPFNSPQVSANISADQMQAARELALLFAGWRSSKCPWPRINQPREGSC